MQQRYIPTRLFNYLFYLICMSDSEVNWLKTGAFTFGFETLPPSSCLCHLTLLVSHLSLRDKWNLICDVDRGLCGTVWCFIPLPPAHVIYSLFVHISDERLRWRNTAIHIIFFPLNYVVITRSFLVITRSFLVITRSFLVITRSFLVITRSFLVITRSFLVITTSFLVKTTYFLVITTSFLVKTTYVSR